MTVLILDNSDLITRTTMAISSAMSPLTSELKPPHQLRFHYGFNKHSLSTNDLAMLKQHAIYLCQHPTIQVLVHGHSDNFGAEDYNQFLARLRASSVIRALGDLGVQESQMTIKIWGSDRPLARLEDHAANRRVELEYQPQSNVRIAHI